MKDQKGFTLFEGLLVFVIVALVGFGGYTVWNKNQDEDRLNNKVKQEDSATQDKPDSVDTKQNSGRNITVNYNDYSFSFELPESWEYEEKELHDFGEHSAVVVDLSNSYRLTMKIFNTNKTSSDTPTTNSQTLSREISGINGKPLYISDTSINEPSLSPMFTFSACDDYFCHYEFKDKDETDMFDYYLGINIERVNESSAIEDLDMTPIDINDLSVKKLLGIIGTITVQ